MPISIGIPFYNAEKTLINAIRSVFAQTYQDWELILVDDGSTDNSLEIAQSVKDSRVRVISDGQNKMLPYRLNQIVAESQYDLIVRMDADDIMFSNRLEMQQHFFENPNVNLVGAAACRISISGEINSLMSCPNTIDINPQNIISGKFRLIHPTIMGRKQWFLANPYDVTLKYSEDLELWIRSSLEGQLTNESIIIYHEPLLFYRETNGGRLITKLLLAEQVRYFIYWKYGKIILGEINTLVQVAKLWLKMRFLQVIAGIGLLPFYFRYISRSVKTFDAISESDYTRFKLELNKILSTKIPEC
jgi:glycosyltransferase involved in cell wall biosynthesis